MSFHILRRIAGFHSAGTPRLKAHLSAGGCVFVVSVSEASPLVGLSRGAWELRYSEFSHACAQCMLTVQLDVKSLAAAWFHCFT